MKVENATRALRSVQMCTLLWYAIRCRGLLTGKRSAGPRWMSRPVRSQFSSVPAIVTVPRAGLNAPPPRPPRAPPRPPLAAGGMLNYSHSNGQVLVTTWRGISRSFWSQKLFDAAGLSRGLTNQSRKSRWGTRAEPHSSPRQTLPSLATTPFHFDLDQGHNCGCYRTAIHESSRVLISNNSPVVEPLLQG